MAVDKLDDDKDEDWPDLIMFEKWHSCMKGFQHLKGNAKKKTDATQIEKNDSRRHRISVQVQTCKKPSKRKAISVH